MGAGEGEQSGGEQNLLYLAPPPRHEQLELTCRNLAGVLIAARPRLEGTRDNRETYDTLRDAVQEWVCTEITRLRFKRPE
jgi:hypothetical protein